MRERDNLKKNVVKMLCVFALVFTISMVCYETAEAKEMVNFPTQSQSSYSTAYTRAIQVMLMNYSQSTRKLILDAGGADGMFGTGTRDAVKAFQKDKGLKQDGICGTNTWRALQNSLVYVMDSGGYIYYKGKYPNETYAMRVKKSTGAWECRYGKWYPVG